MWSENFTLEKFKKANRDNTEPYIYVRGKIASGNEVWGVYVGMNAGICLSVYTNHKIFRLINDFSYTTTMPQEMNYTVNETLDIFDTIHQLTPWTIHFWLSAGYNTKHYLTTYELKTLRILDAMSEEGLSRWVKPAPILRAAVGGHFYIRATKSDKDYFQSDDSEFFIETGELPPHEEGYMAPRPISSRISIKKNEQINKWHLARAQHFRKGDDTRVELKSGCENYSSSYTFDDDCHILHMYDVNPQRETSFQVRLPTHPSLSSSKVNSLVGSPAEPFVLRDPPRLPYMIPLAVNALDNPEVSPHISPITDVYSLESTRILRPIPIRAKAKSYREVRSVRHPSDSTMEAVKKSTDEQHETYDDKVARLSTQQITEALDIHHRTIKRFYRKYQGYDIPPLTEEELYHAEEWCMAAYLQLRMRR